VGAARACPGGTPRLQAPAECVLPGPAPRRCAGRRRARRPAGWGLAAAGAARRPGTAGGRWRQTADPRPPTTLWAGRGHEGKHTRTHTCTHTHAKHGNHTPQNDERERRRTGDTAGPPHRVRNRSRVSCAVAALEVSAVSRCTAARWLACWPRRRFTSASANAWSTLLELSRMRARSSCDGESEGREGGRCTARAAGEGRSCEKGGNGPRSQAGSEGAVRK
jgi:hypothetical protein